MQKSITINILLVRYHFVYYLKHLTEVTPQLNFKVFSVKLISNLKMVKSFFLILNCTETSVFTEIWITSNSFSSRGVSLRAKVSISTSKTIFRLLTCYEFFRKPGIKSN